MDKDIFQSRDLSLVAVSQQIVYFCKPPPVIDHAMTGGGLAVKSSDPNTQGKPVNNGSGFL